jgi:phosphatidylethanolamine-binding protein (PEBP) family uncharacterized protein
MKVSKAGNPALNLMPGNWPKSTTSFGATGFGGPCPPVGHGIHIYFHSLRIKTDNLGLDATANPELVGYNLWANTIAKTIVAHYKR